MNITGCEARTDSGFEVVVETSPHWITTTDLEWRVLWANQPAADLVGVASPGAMLGCLVLEWLAPEDRPRAEAARREVRERKTTSTVECHVVRADGAHIPVELVASALRTAEGEAGGYVIVVRDLTEPRRRANTEKLEALGQMASGVAHDLNQSLALITGYVELARQEIGRADAVIDTALVAGHLDVVWQAAMDGGHTVKRLLAFARVHERTATEPIDVGTLLDETARLTAPRWRDAAQAEGRPIRLIVHVAPRLYIQGDPATLREALINLVFNAVDALPTGGDITLAGYADNDAITIAVSDTGMGMTPRVRERIFDPFYTTKGERGTGLGLPQVRAAVQQHNGTIAVQSEPGVGTTFEIRLPLARSFPATANSVAPVGEPIGMGVRVLVVEDDIKLANLAAMLLTRDKHQVVIVDSAEHALEHLQEHGADIVLSDLGLGHGMNGWDLAEKVHQQWPTTRMLLATGWAGAIDPEEARKRGIQRVLAKPYRAAELRSAVASLSGDPGPDPA